jgi:hypothetical protein
MKAKKLAQNRLPCRFRRLRRSMSAHRSGSEACVRQSSFRFKRHHPRPRLDLLVRLFWLLARNEVYRRFCQETCSQGRTMQKP